MAPKLIITSLQHFFTYNTFCFHGSKRKRCNKLELYSDTSISGHLYLSNKYLEQTQVLKDLYDQFCQYFLSILTQEKDCYQAPMLQTCTPDREILRFTPCEKFLSHPCYLTQGSPCIQVYLFNIGSTGCHINLF